MRAVLVLLAASVLATAPALAADDNTGGFYFGVGLGDFSTGVDDLSDVDEANLDFQSGENAQKIFAGWRFNRFVALQIDRVDFERSVDAAVRWVMGKRSRGHPGLPEKPTEHVRFLDGGKPDCNVASFTLAIRMMDL